MIFPEITLQLPMEGSVFNYLETITIRASVSDNQNLERIQVLIVDEQNNSYLSQFTMSDAGKSKQIDTYITHDNLYLNSGIYYVKIIAQDKDNESIAFRKITLTEAPTQLKYIYLIRENNQSTLVDTLSNSSSHLFYTLPHGYKHGSINSRDNLLLACNDDKFYVLNASTTANLFFYHYNTSNVLKSVYDNNGSSFYSATNDGYIFETDRYGSNRIFAYLPNQRITNLLVTENFVFADVQNQAQTIRTLSVFSKSTGAFFQSVQVYFDLKELIYSGSENQIVVVGNELGGGVLKYYNRQTNFFNDVFSLYNHSTMYGAWPTSPGQFVVSQEAGLITYSNNLTMLSNGVSLLPLKIVYERLSGLNYALTQSGVYVLNTNATQQINYISSSNCKDIHLLYNK